MLIPKNAAPTVVASVPVDAGRCMMQMPDGEIRLYGYNVRKCPMPRDEVVPIVMKSSDGASWTTEEVASRVPGAMSVSPWSGRYLTIIHSTKNESCHLAVWNPLAKTLPEPGIYCIRSASPEGPFEERHLEFEGLHIQRLPLALKKRRRWLVPYQGREADGLTYYWGVLLSDDDGDSWRKIVCAAPPVPGVLPGHGGLRWIHCGLEPIVAEDSTGRLHALLRCAHDCHYQCFSDDGGETWSTPEPSRFYADATMPGLYALSGGRLLAVWNNTVPLYEEDHRTQPGGNDPDVLSGKWEDVFTNRDALHAAISHDNGKTWRGFRELLLNSERNAGDFRSVMVSYDTLDKSVHQNQIAELSDGRVFVCAGQNFKARKALVFDPAWLEETNRHEDFSAGYGNLSVHQFLKSPVGGFQGISGHCAYNRRPGAALVPHPDRTDREVLLVGRHPDDRLVSDLEGVAWNFTAAQAGRVRVRLRENRGSAGVRLMLTDRWVNPSDPHAADYAVFAAELRANGVFAGAEKTLKLDAWHDAELAWDLHRGTAELRLDGEKIADLPRRLVTPNAVSYLHIQTMAAGADPFGVMFESFDFAGDDVSPC